MGFVRPGRAFPRELMYEPPALRKSILRGLIMLELVARPCHPPAQRP